MSSLAVNVETGAYSTSGRYRWLICALLFLITVNNYMDRQMLSIVAPAITAEFHLSASDLALTISAFLATYGLGQFLSGRFMDWIGARWGFTLAVLVWSLASIFTSLARSVAGFGVFRFILGAAESGNFAGGVKVIAQLFPPNERTTAVGFFASGVSIGAVLTPPLAAYLIVHYGWRLAFVVVGLPGLLWIGAWLAAFRPVTPVVSHFGAGHKEAGAVSNETRQWTFLLRHRLVWGLILGRFVEEPAGWFFFSWLPLYLKTFPNLSLINIGFLLIIPFAMLDLGFLAGGWAASHLLRAGRPVDTVRKTLMFVSAICMTSTIAAVSATTPLAFVLLIGIATFGHGSWSSNIMVMPSDILPHSSVGTLYGLAAACGSLGSILFMTLTGRLIDMQHSYHSVFVIVGLLPIAGAILTFAVAGPIRRLPSLATSEA
jgi:ACS family hexuronate transporter-like MFS transporter